MESLHCAQPSELFEEQIIYPFGPGIYVTTVPDKILSILKTASETAASKDKKINWKLVGEIKGEYDLEFDEYQANEYQNFLVEKLRNYQRNLQDGTFQDIDSAAIEQPWVNFTHPGEFNPMHIHTSDLSYIIYLDIPEPVRNNYKESQSKVKGIIEFMANNKHFHLSPKTGDMVIFPSTVYHCVYPFDAEGVRISVAGNVHQVRTKDRI
jgi:predicted 2-oxoglutarate/Fe(II)-dependent dioxygenase YbiX